MVYQTLYASWSKMSHVSDTLHLTFPLEDGSSILGPIRNPMNSINIGTTTLSHLIEVTKLMMEKYRSYESNKFYKWYGSEIRDQHIALVNLEVGHVNWFDKTFIQKQ
jgi:hypothetical protein